MSRIGSYLKNNTVLVIIYSLLFAVFVSWTNPDVLPSMALRILFLAGMFVPYIISNKTNKAIFICAFCFFKTVSDYGYSMSYMPASYPLCALVCIVFFIICKPEKVESPLLSNVIFVTFIYVSIVNIVTAFEIPNIVYAFIITMIAAKYLSAKGSRGILEWAFILSSLVLSAYMIIFKDMITMSYGVSDLERSGWNDPNYFGCVVAFGALAGVIKIMRGPTDILEKTIIVIAICMSLSAIFLCGSRGAILAFALPVIFLIFLTKIRIGYRILLIGVLAVLLYYFWHNSYMDLLIYRIQADDGTGSNRTEIWAEKLNAYFGNPIGVLFGNGYMGGRTINSGTTQVGFHNDFVAALVDYGAVGFIIIMTCLFSPFIKLRYKFSQGKYAIASILLIATVMLTLEPISDGLLSFYFFYLYSLCLANESKLILKND